MKSIKKVLFILVILSLIIQIVIPKAYAKGVSTIIYNGESLYEKIGNQAVLDNIRSEHVASDTGIDFTKGASSTNGQGVYTIASTANDKFPIYYYRGNVDNNNVLFGGFCWQIVRTTETGGVKLIYNGSPDENGKCVNTEINWDLQINNSRNNTSYMYGFDIGNVDYNDFPSNWYALAEKISKDIYYSWESDISNNDFYYSEEVEYSKETNKYTLKNAKEHKAGESIEEIKGKNPTYFCPYLEECYSVELILWDTYEEDDSVHNLQLSNGLTYNDIIKKNLIFGNDAEYKKGKYNLKNTISIPLMSSNSQEYIKKVLDEHHYFCDDFTSSCENVNYIYTYTYYDEYEFNYVVFSNGDNADNVYNEIKNSTNENDSKMKEVIDKWYSENLVDSTKYLEDTIWCNDRSRIGNEYNKDEIITKNLFSDYYGRGGYYDGEIDLKLSCSNIQDRFTVNSKNGNGKLTYPTATITAQEVIYAGGPFENIDNIKSRGRESFSYLKLVGYTMTPMDVRTGLYLVEGDMLTFDSFNCKSIEGSCFPGSEVLPMVSLKHSMVVSSGDGSPANPYEVVEGNTVEYVIDGDMPNGFIPPEVESYLKGSKVKLNSLKAGDVINGYRFLGWETKDVEIENNEFEMPDKNVVLIGRFEKIIETPNTLDDIGKYITIALISSLTLAISLITKKRITN